MMRMSRDRIIPKKDPERRFAQQHFNWIIRRTSLPFTPVILTKSSGGQWTTALEWYDRWTATFGDDTECALFELRFADYIATILFHRGVSVIKKGVEEKNRALRRVLDNAEQSQFDKVLRDIFNDVHPSQWRCLLARWAWYSGTTFFAWRTKTIDAFIYKSNEHYAEFKAMQKKWKLGNSAVVQLEQFQRKMPAHWVDYGCVEVLRTFLSYLDRDERIPPFSYHHTDHLSAELEDLYKFWNRRHYFSPETCRIEGYSDRCIDLNREVVQKRMRLQLRPQRIQYLFNNYIVAQWGLFGTTFLEFLHSWMNYWNISRSRRNVWLSFLQLLILQISFNFAHSNHVYRIKKSRLYTPEILKKIGEQYLRIDSLAQHFKSLLSDQPRKRLLRLSKDSSAFKKDEAAIIKSCELPSSAVLWKKNKVYNETLLVIYLMLTSMNSAPKIQRKIKSKGAVGGRVEDDINEEESDDGEGDIDAYDISGDVQHRVLFADEKLKRLFDTCYSSSPALFQTPRRGKMERCTALEVEQSIVMNQRSVYQIEPLSEETVMNVHSKLFEGNFSMEETLYRISNAGFMLPRYQVDGVVAAGTGDIFATLNPAVFNLIFEFVTFCCDAS